MATNTYIPLATTTLNTSTAYYDFTNIPQTYTDLVLVITTFATSNAQPSGTFQVGTGGTLDTGANYSQTMLYGTGSGAATTRAVNASVGFWDAQGISASTTTPNIAILNFQNYSNTTTYKTILGRAAVADTGTVASINTWRNTGAINVIRVMNYTGYNMGAGSTFSLYGIKSEPVVSASAKATGGTITYDSFGYVYHTFTSSGTFTPSQALTNVDYLIVGGGGGTCWGTGGGGGAGGLRSTLTATGGGGYPESKLSLSATGYTVTVGGPGALTTSRNTRGGAGGDSTFNGITASGGSGGAGNSSGNNAITGGSGGGGSGAYAAGSGTTNQGYAGASGADGVSAWTGGGGGGGAGGVGQAAGVRGTYYAGNGGIGVALPEFASATGTGVQTYYAGGGGGGGNGNNATAADGVGGMGGGGNGSNVPGRTTAGATNTGGGAGGSGDGEATGKNGGSGIVIIRYYGA